MNHMLLHTLKYSVISLTPGAQQSGGGAKDRLVIDWGGGGTVKVWYVDLKCRIYYLVACAPLNFFIVLHQIILPSIHGVTALSVSRPVLG